MSMRRHDVSVLTDDEVPFFEAHDPLGFGTTDTRHSFRAAVACLTTRMLHTEPGLSWVSLQTMAE